MSDVTGRWQVETVEVIKGSGKHAPKEGSEILIEEIIRAGEPPFYGFLFVTQEDQPTPLKVPVDPDAPDKLILRPPPDEAGYALFAGCGATADQSAALEGDIFYGFRGGEDNDTATFTATKTTYAL